MSKPIFVGLALLLFLLMPLGGPADAQDRCGVAQAQTGAAAVLNMTDRNPSMTGAFNDRTSSDRSRSGSHGASGDIAGLGDKAAADVAALLVAGGGFACGPDLACDPATQYCAVVIGGPKGTAPGYSCVDLPDAFSPPTCERIADIIGGCACQQSNGGVTVTCAAP